MLSVLISVILVVLLGKLIDYLGKDNIGEFVGLGIMVSQTNF
jgi:hypothetical protein